MSDTPNYKKPMRFTISRILLIIVALAVQFYVYYIVILYLTEKNWIISICFRIAATIVVLRIINRRINPAYKLIWTIFIMLVPIAGMIFYIIGGKSRIAGKMEDSFHEVDRMENPLYQEDPEVRKRLKKEDPAYEGQSAYMKNYANAPCHDRTTVRYYGFGEDWYPDFLEDLKSAEHFIFLEYFIIADGYLWNSVLNILKEKAAKGVDVRLIYDGVGCMTTLRPRYYRELQKDGIKCACFNPFRPFLNIILNNRDHKKIAVIDGNVGYSGGINLADEYINKKKRFGRWKDAGIRLHGDAVWNFTFMFLKMWDVITGVHDLFTEYRPNEKRIETFQTNGFVQPFDDTPLDGETVGENVYLNIITHATDYVYIFTPYLVLDNEMMTALCNASKRGVDVRIVTPGIPDKKMVYTLSRSYYGELIDAGVRIFEYSPGFIHAKCFVADDVVAVVGTINLDYRSLYLHFENGVWMYKTDAVMDVKRDALETFEVSREIDQDFVRKRNVFSWLLSSIMRVIAPLL